MQLLFSDTLFKWKFADDDYNEVMNGFLSSAAPAGAASDDADGANKETDADGAGEDGENAEAAGGDGEAAGGGSKDGDAAGADASAAAPAASSALRFLRFVELYSAVASLAKVDPKWSGDFTAETLAEAVSANNIRKAAVDGITAAVDESASSDSDAAATIWPLVRNIIAAVQATDGNTVAGLSSIFCLLFLTMCELFSHARWILRVH